MFTNLESVGIIITGNTPPKNNLKNYGNYLPWVKPSQLNSDMSILTTPEKLSKLGSLHARILEENSILISCIGELGKIGYAGCKLATILPNKIL